MGGVKILNSRKKIYKIFLLIKLYLWKGVTLKLRQQDFWPLPPSLRSSAEIDQTFSNPKVKKTRKPDHRENFYLQMSLYLKKFIYLFIFYFLGAPGT